MLECKWVFQICNKYAKHVLQNWDYKWRQTNKIRNMRHSLTNTTKICKTITNMCKITNIYDGGGKQHYNLNHIHWKQPSLIKIQFTVAKKKSFFISYWLENLEIINKQKIFWCSYYATLNDIDQKVIKLAKLWEFARHQEKRQETNYVSEFYTFDWWKW